MPKRLVGTGFEATRDDQVAVLEPVDEVKAQLAAAFQAHGYGIGINAGVAAGRTVRHCPTGSRGNTLAREHR